MAYLVASVEAVPGPNDHVEDGRACTVAVACWEEVGKTAAAAAAAAAVEVVQKVVVVVAVGNQEGVVGEVLVQMTVAVHRVAC